MQVLSTEMLQQRAPAAFTERHPMTARYVQVPTFKVVEQLADVGYYPVSAQQTKPFQRNPQFVEHKIVLRHETQLKARLNVDEIPQIIISNSHNGRTKLRLWAGFYRLVCSNGLVVGNDLFRYEVAHMGDAYAEAMGFADMMTTELENLREVIDHWNNVHLTAGQAHTFAQRAAVLRFGEQSAGSYSPQALLHSRRAEDEGDSLWKVFNRLQENTVKGGIEGMNGNRRRVRSRELTAVNPNIEYNAALWNLAQQFAEAA